MNVGDLLCSMVLLRRLVLSVMNGQIGRGHWLTAREIAHRVYQTDWAAKEQVAAIRGALRRLEIIGEVRSQGIVVEWTTTRHPTPPRTGFEQRVLAELTNRLLTDDQVRQLVPDQHLDGGPLRAVRARPSAQGHLPPAAG